VTTEELEIEIGWLQSEARGIGLFVEKHLRADSGKVSLYVQESKKFTGGRYQAKPTSLAKFLNLWEAQAFVAEYRQAFPKGRADG
jgi:hypothetical protein